MTIRWSEKIEVMSFFYTIIIERVLPRSILPRLYWLKWGMSPDISKKFLRTKTYLANKSISKISWMFFAHWIEKGFNDKIHVKFMSYIHLDKNFLRTQLKYLKPLYWSLSKRPYHSLFHFKFIHLKLIFQNFANLGIPWDGMSWEWVWVRWDGLDWVSCGKLWMRRKIWDDPIISRILFRSSFIITNLFLWIMN